MSLNMYESETCRLHFQGIIQGFKNLEEDKLGNQCFEFHQKLSNQLDPRLCLALK